MTTPHRNIHKSDLNTPARDQSVDPGLPDVMQQTLSAPLPRKIAATHDQEQEALAAFCHKRDPSIETVADLLTHPAPPTGLLVMLKNTAKTARKSASEMPYARVATALYYAAIGIAWLQRHEIITTVALNDLDERLEWTASQPWGNDEVTSLLRKAAKEVQGPDWSPEN